MPQTPVPPPAPPPNSPNPEALRIGHLAAYLFQSVYAHTAAMVVAREPSEA